MAHRQAATVAATSPVAIPYKRALIVLAGFAVCAIAYVANREIVHDVDDQVAQEESAFCRNLGVQAGANYQSCIQEVSRLMRREREIRSVEF